MCGRFTLQVSPESLVALFGAIACPEISPSSNVAPSQQVLIARQDTESRTRLDYVRWGLIPSWASDPSTSFKTINARCETIGEKPAFRQAIRYRRCLVPASGFVEWDKRGGEKIPYHVVLKDGSVMVFAGLWESWKSSEGTVIESCTILTTCANKVVEKIHDRMPVILHPAEFDLWLDRDQHDPEKLQRLYQPFPAEMLQMHQVSPQINNPKNDSPDLLLPIQSATISEPQLLSLPTT